jgi:thiol-disulfide isomerase/thioredoxin
MKNHNLAKKICVVLALGLLIGSNLQAQETGDTTAWYLDRLIQSKSVSDKALLESKLKALAGSDREKDMMLAANIYYSMKNTRISDSLQKAELVKFPIGIAARNKAEQAVYNSKDPESAEKQYKEWVAKFPPENFSDEDHDHVVYDYARLHVAQLYAEQKNVTKAKQFADMFEEEFWKGNAYGGLSAVFYKNGDLVNAEMYAKKAMESAKSFLNATGNAGKFAASGYPGLCNTYVNILYEEKKYEDALKYIDVVYKLNKEVNPQTNYTYAKLLMHAGRNKEAYDKLDAVMISGKASSEMNATFKELYPKVKGSYVGYNSYMAAVDNVIQKNLQETVTNAAMNKPAPLFTLTDVNGKKVSLEQLRGKTVILDFWATWCGPCKRSFPAMQIAQDKYKNDPNVKFLFIHTWERDNNATAEAKKYVQDNHYNFEVLMDLKDPETKENKVVSSYGVTGIPAKFIIDPMGNIRYHLTGFEGSNEEAVNEISMMIEGAKKAG